MYYKTLCYTVYCIAVFFPIDASSLADFSSARTGPGGFRRSLRKLYKSEAPRNSPDSSITKRIDEGDTLT